MYITVGTLKILYFGDFLQLLNRLWFCFGCFGSFLRSILVLECWKIQFIGCAILASTAQGANWGAFWGHFGLGPAPLDPKNKQWYAHVREYWDGREAKVNNPEIAGIDLEESASFLQGLFPAGEQPGSPSSTHRFIFFYRRKTSPL